MTSSNPPVPDFLASSPKPEPHVHLVVTNSDKVTTGLIFLGGAELAALLRWLAIQEKIEVLDIKGPMLGQSFYPVSDKFLYSILGVCELASDVAEDLPEFMLREKGSVNYTIVISQ